MLSNARFFFKKKNLGENDLAPVFEAYSLDCEINGEKFTGELKQFRR